MAGGDEKKGNDLYAVLGLQKECTSTELRNAYKKLAMKWHPDRCSASGNSKFADEAKKKFQAIQEAYSVLSDNNKRLLYDVGIYDEDDDDNNNGMGDFLNEMATMMSQTKTSENGEDSYEEFQNLFDEIFRQDTASSSSSYSSSGTNKRNSSQLNYTVGSSSSSSFFFFLHTHLLHSNLRSWIGCEVRRTTKGNSEKQRWKQETLVAADSGMAGDGGCRPMAEELDTAVSS